MIVYLQIIETEEDKSKFEQIYLEYRGLMYHIAYEHLHSSQDAEDVVHQVFLKIAEKIKIIEPVSPKTKRLLVIMVEHKITDFYRVQGNHPAVAYEDDLRNSVPQEAETDHLLSSCILKLPEQQRTVIWLKYVQGYDLREIAKLLGISLTWAQKIDQRAKKKLEALYRAEGGQL